MLTKNELKQLIAEGKTKQAIEALLAAARSHGDIDLLNDVTHQSARFEQAKRQEMLGTADPDDLRRQMAQINHALLDIIDRLPAKPAQSGGTPNPPLSSPPVVGDPGPNPLPPGEPSRRSLWLGATTLFAVAAIFAAMVLLQGKMGNAEPLGEMLFIVLLGILAGVAYFQLMPSHAEGDGKFFGMNLKFRGPVVAGVLVAAGSFLFLQARDGSQPFDYTVSLQPDPALKLSPGYPMLKDARLLLRLDNKWEPSGIVDEHGDADFKSIAGDFKNDRVAARLQGSFWKLVADSLKLEGKSQTIYLVPDGSLGELIGKVKSEKDAAPLEGVIVEAEEVKDTTDAQGNFRLIIPVERQKSEYQLFAKKGASSLTQTVYAGTNQDIRFKK